MISDDLYNRYYADPKYDGTTAFYDYIRDCLPPASEVLNFGAGPATKNPKRILKSDMNRIVGADIDPIVLENEELDEAVVVDSGGRLPFENNRFDLVYSDFVLEHVEFPERFCAEVFRVLKPGGAFLFRTPNINHYVALGSKVLPHRLHKAFANNMRGLGEDAHEPWPTFYRMNSKRCLSKIAKTCGFSGHEFRMFEAEPSYLLFHPVPFYFGLGYERLVNATEALSGLRACIFGKFTK